MKGAPLWQRVSELGGKLGALLRQNPEASKEFDAFVEHVLEIEMETRSGLSALTRRMIAIEELWGIDPKTAAWTIERGASSDFVEVKLEGVPTRWGEFKSTIETERGLRGGLRHYRRFENDAADTHAIELIVEQMYVSAISDEMQRLEDLRAVQVGPPTVPR